MQTLLITNYDGTTAVSVRIEDVNPNLATVAILNALAKLPKPRKTRSDAGTTKTKISQHAAGADAAE